MVDQAKNQQISVSQGSVEAVPSRSGVGHMDRGLLLPTQDEFTEKRRAHYGEDPTFQAPQAGGFQNLTEQPNNIKSNLKNNEMTRDELARRSNEIGRVNTTWGRTM